MSPAILYDPIAFRDELIRLSKLPKPRLLLLRLLQFLLALPGRLQSQIVPIDHLIEASKVLVHGREELPLARVQIVLLCGLGVQALEHAGGAVVLVEVLLHLPELVAVDRREGVVRPQPR